MTDDGNHRKDCEQLVSQIQEQFQAKGWRPLLPIKVERLQALSPEQLEQLLPRINNATDRMDAVRIVVEAIAFVSDEPLA